MSECAACDASALDGAVLLVQDGRVIRLCEGCGNEAVKAATAAMGPLPVLAAMARCERCGTRSLAGYGHVAVWRVGATIPPKPGKAGAQRLMRLLCPACSDALGRWLRGR